MSPQAQNLLVYQIAPRIRALAPSLKPVGSEDLEELTNEATALAASILASTEARGKSVTAGNIAFYAVGLVRQGRRSIGQSRTDVMHPATQLSGRAELISLDAASKSEIDGQDVLCLH